MAQRVLPEGQHRHRFDGTLQNGQSQRKLSGLTAHLYCFDPIGPIKQDQKLGLFQLFNWIPALGLNNFLPHDDEITQRSVSSDLYLCEAQLGCMRGAGTLFSS